MKIGQKVRYYNYTTCQHETGEITALDVTVDHIWEDEKTQSKNHFPGSKNPLGLEINGSLTRTYSSVSLIN